MNAEWVKKKYIPDLKLSRGTEVYDCQKLPKFIDEYEYSMQLI